MVPRNSRALSINVGETIIEGSLIAHRIPSLQGVPYMGHLRRIIDTPAFIFSVEEVGTSVVYTTNTTRGPGMCVHTRIQRFSKYQVVNRNGSLFQCQSLARYPMTGSKQTKHFKPVDPTYLPTLDGSWWGARVRFVGSSTICYDAVPTRQQETAHGN